MSAQTIVNAVNWSVVIGFILWINLLILEAWHATRVRRNTERRATRERFRP